MVHSSRIASSSLLAPVFLEMSGLPATLGLKTIVPIAQMLCSNQG